MSYRHVVVDGSNIATEGRSSPSLAQLDEAVRAFRNEFPRAEITVVVDATFAHRIEERERGAYEEAEAHNELVSPPAGAIGRGDAFLLRIAEKIDATVLSNDSFQEFHGEHEWLFSDGRLVGGKPVPGVGWIFTPRTPVRGVKSRKATKDARRGASREASGPLPVPKTAPPRAPAKSKAKAAASPAEKRPAPRLRRAIAAATEEAVAPEQSAPRRSRRRGAGPPPHAVNEPLTFITFIADHPLGSRVSGDVESFTSHGAFVEVGDARCYVPLAGLGVPPPRSAREVLERGERRTFVLQALDPQRRGIELALPEAASVAGTPSDETVEADMAASTAAVPAGKRAGTRGKASAKKARAKTLKKSESVKGAGRARSTDAAGGTAKVKAKGQAKAPTKAATGRPAKARTRVVGRDTEAAGRKTTTETSTAKTGRQLGRRVPAKTKTPPTKTPPTKTRTTKTRSTKTGTTKTPPTKTRSTKGTTGTKAPAKAPTPAKRSR